MKHEPSGFLSDANSAVKLVRANAVLAVGEHPDRHKPVLERQGRVLENRPDANRELLLAAFALPQLARGDERVFRRLAEGAKDGIGPAQFNGKAEGVVLIGKELDSLLEGFRELRLVHASNLGPRLGCVTYIITRDMDLLFDQCLTAFRTASESAIVGRPINRRRSPLSS